MHERLKTIIVDDEPDALKVLELVIEAHCPEIELVAICKCPKEALKTINKEDFDLLILDIDMPYLNGFELLEMSPKKNYKVVFLTAHDKYAIKAIKISAFDYLLKPVNPEELKSVVRSVITSQSIENVKTNFEFLVEQFNAIKLNEVPSIALPTFQGLDFTKLDEIIYCKADDSYCNVFLSNNRKITLSKPLAYLEELLCQYHFYRIHKSYIVNLKKIDKYIRSDGGYLIMENQDHVSISRSKKDDFLKMATKILGKLT